MIGLVMAGGKGSRMKADTEKLVMGKKAMVLRVIEAMKGSGLFENIVATTSKNSPEAKKIIEKSSVKIIETSGSSYVDDLASALQSLHGDVMIVPGDLGLLDSQILRNAHALYTDKDAWTVIMATAEFAKSLGAKPDYVTDIDGRMCAYTGVSIVNTDVAKKSGHIREDPKILNDKRIALNVNTRDDYALLDESLLDDSLLDESLTEP